MTSIKNCKDYANDTKVIKEIITSWNNPEDSRNFTKSFTEIIEAEKHNWGSKS